jgi:disulfide bond formation protein DsbB
LGNQTLNLQKTIDCPSVEFVLTTNIIRYHDNFSFAPILLVFKINILGDTLFTSGMQDLMAEKCCKMCLCQMSYLFGSVYGMEASERKYGVALPLILLITFILHIGHTVQMYFHQLVHE